jgi:predicted DNA-binding WGR domain protein
MVYLERRDARVNMARAYAVHVEPTLFGDWALIRHWGRIGARGRHLEEWFDTREAALTAGQRLAARKRRRGYGERPTPTRRL